MDRGVHRTDHMTRRNDTPRHNLSIHGLLLHRTRRRVLGATLALVGCDDGDDGEFTGAVEATVEPQGDEAASMLAPDDAEPESAAAVAHLRRYGYFPNPELAERYPGWTPVVDVEPEDPTQFDEALGLALTRYQEAHGLAVTGELDAETRALMRQPRCGVPDHYMPRPLTAGGNVDGAGDAERSASGARGLDVALTAVVRPTAYTPHTDRWRFAEFKLGYKNYSTDVGVESQRQAVAAAMNTWATVAPIAWVERANPDISVEFVSHADENLPGFEADTFAHGFYPRCNAIYGGFECNPLSGDLHFNDAAFTWGTGNGNTVQDIRTHALHTLGHALGLGHSSDPYAVMYGVFAPGVKRHVLAQSDIAAIKAEYPFFRDARVFDAWWYPMLNEDVRYVYGEDPLAVSKHWLAAGRYEGRSATPVFDVRDYLKRNPDVAQAYGANNYAAALWHWRENGIKEGRRASPAFDSKYYLAKYADFGPADYSAALVHWLSVGIEQGRRASAEFDPKYYMQNNPDVAQVYGATNYKMGLFHWLRFGISEGRKGAA